MLSRVRHPNIVIFYGINITNNVFQLCTELCADSMDRLLSNPSIKLDKVYYDLFFKSEGQK